MTAERAAQRPGQGSVTNRRCIPSDRTDRTCSTPIPSGHDSSARRGAHCSIACHTDPRRRAARTGRAADGSARTRKGGTLPCTYWCTSSASSAGRRSFACRQGRRTAAWAAGDIVRRRTPFPVGRGCRRTPGRPSTSPRHRGKRAGGRRATPCRCVPRLRSRQRRNPRPAGPANGGYRAWAIGCARRARGLRVAARTE